MKSTKVKVTVLLIFMLLFIVLGGVCFAFPNGFSAMRTNVKVVEDFQVVNKNGDHSFTGIIKNTGKKPIEIIELVLFCEPTNQNTGTVRCVANENTIILQPGETYNLSSEGVQFHTNSSALYEVDYATVKTSDNITATVYQKELSSEIVLIILVCFLAALILAVGAIYLQGLEWRSKRRIELAQDVLKQNPKAIFLLGALCEKEPRGSIKSLLSVLGGIFRAVFFGVRIYTKYSNAIVVDMFLTDEGLYFGAGDESKINIENMDLIGKNDVKFAKISGDKTNVVLDFCNGRYIAFDIKSTGISKENLITLLNRVFCEQNNSNKECDVDEKNDEEPFA